MICHASLKPVRALLSFQWAWSISLLLMKFTAKIHHPHPEANFIVHDEYMHTNFFFWPNSDYYCTLSMKSFQQLIFPIIHINMLSGSQCLEASRLLDPVNTEWKITTTHARRSLNVSHLFKSFDKCDSITDSHIFNFARSRYCHLMPVGDCFFPEGQHIITAVSFHHMQYAYDSQNMYMSLNTPEYAPFMNPAFSSEFLELLFWRWERWILFRLIYATL